MNTRTSTSTSKTKGPRGQYDGNRAVSWECCHWQPNKSSAEAIRQANLVDVLAAAIREHGVRPRS